MAEQRRKPGIREFVDEDGIYYVATDEDGTRSKHRTLEAAQAAAAAAKRPKNTNIICRDCIPKL